MSKIVSTSDLQKNIGSLIDYSEKDFIILTRRGKAKAVILPYFEDNDEALANYLEHCEMHKNQKKLSSGYKKSLQSGESNLII